MSGPVVLGAGGRKVLYIDARVMKLGRPGIIVKTAEGSWSCTRVLGDWVITQYADRLVADGPQIVGESDGRIELFDSTPIVDAPTATMEALSSNG